MRLLFVHVTADSTVSYAHGIAALAGQLRGSCADQAGSMEARVAVLAASGPGDAAQLLEMDPDVILFSATSNQWERVLGIAHDIKRLDSRMTLVIGGAHATARPNQVIATGVFDTVVSGEADEVLPDILSSESKIHGSEPRLIVADPPRDLDTLARPAVDLFAPEDILQYPSVMFSRGCPFGCTYCMSRRGGTAASVRWKSPQRALDEVLDLIAHASPPAIYFDDDTLLKRPKWIREFAPIYERSVDLPYHCNARPETIRRDLTDLLAATGCAAIGIGIESGNPKLRADVLGRPMSDETIIEAFRTSAASGLSTWSFNMVGIPGEQPDDVRGLIELNERCKVDFVRLSIFTPYPGTPLGDTMLSGGVESYFRGWEEIGEEKMAILRPWLLQLDREGRLWWTKSEHALMESNFR